jgi:hypothetical protein
MTGKPSSRLLKKFKARSILLMFSRVSGEPKDADRRYWGVFGVFCLIFGTPDGLIPWQR